MERAKDCKKQAMDINCYHTGLHLRLGRKCIPCKMRDHIVNQKWT